MARIRQVKPEFFLDDELAAIARDARLLFIGLWTIADRDGRLEDRPAKIKAQLFPYDADLTYQKIDALLNNLAIPKYIIRYQIDGRKYIQIRSFNKHQHCHVKESPSTIPAPCLTDANQPSTVQAPDLHRTSPHTSTSTNASTSTDGEMDAAAAQALPPEEPLLDPSIPIAKKERKKDEAYEAFATEFLRCRGIPYGSGTADFVQLAKLRKLIGTTSEIPKWDKAIDSYFKTPQGKYTLADLCSRFDAFIHGPLDRYGKPIEGKPDGNDKFDFTGEPGATSEQRNDRGEKLYIPKQM